MNIDNFLQNYNILVCDDSITVLRIISSYLEKAGSKVYKAMNGKEGLDVCLNNEIHLIISDINMPEMDGFEFFASLDTKHKSIPRIMMTDADIDEYINLAIDHNIGNILSKPIEMKELINLCFKLISGEKIFGLQYYMAAKKLYRFNISNSKNIQKIIEHILQFGMDNSLPQSKTSFLSIILDEVLSNAVYHAHGFTREKEAKIAISLDPDDKVEVCFGCTDRHLGISVTDFKGVLTKQRILNSFKRVIEEKKLIEKAVSNGEDISSSLADTGRGLQMIRLMTNRYYFNIRMNKMTQVIIIVSLDEKKTSSISSSIKIQEVY